MPLETNELKTRFDPPREGIYPSATALTSAICSMKEQRARRETASIGKPGWLMRRVVVGPVDGRKGEAVKARMQGGRL